MKATTGATAVFCGMSSVWFYDNDEEAQKKMAQSQKREDSFVKYAKKFYPRAKTRLNTVQDASQNAPVFGSIVKKKILDKDIEDVFPEYSESFAKWCNDKKQEYKVNVAKASSLEMQETFEDCNEIYRSTSLVWIRRLSLPIIAAVQTILFANNTKDSGNGTCLTVRVLSGT